MGWRSRPVFSCVAALVLTLSATAQVPNRRPTTIDALRQFPGYYHLQQVLVRGDLVATDVRVMLRTEEHEIRLQLPPGTKPVSGPVEVRGLLYDVGRMEPGDGRLAGYERVVADSWPKPGEELILSAASITIRQPGVPLSLRTLALEPWRFDGQSVTLVGQFRGRNLFGDLPGAPRRSQFDFVVKSVDAAIWVVGLRPRGKGFDLDVDARVDTGRWLEITGVARRTGGLVIVEASRILPANEPAASLEPEEPITPGPPPVPVEVVFSAPTRDESDVSPGTLVRVQFSRNIRPETLKDRIRIAYSRDVAGAPAAAALASDALPEWQMTYDEATRALQLKFTRPLEPFRVVRVELLEGILAFDGAPFVPWSLTFTVGN